MVFWLAADVSEHAVYPYRLRGLTIEYRCEVWCGDITYIPRRGLTLLMAVFGRFIKSVVSWWLSNTPETGICLEARDAALDEGQPLIFNTDQGAQLASTVWIE